MFVRKKLETLIERTPENSARDKKRERERQKELYFLIVIFSSLIKNILCGVQHANSVTYHIAGWLPGTCGCWWLPKTCPITKPIRLSQRVSTLCRWGVARNWCGMRVHSHTKHLFEKIEVYCNLVVCLKQYCAAKGLQCPWPCPWGWCNNSTGL